MYTSIIFHDVSEMRAPLVVDGAWEGQCDIYDSHYVSDVPRRSCQLANIDRRLYIAEVETGNVGCYVPCGVKYGVKPGVKPRTSFHCSHHAARFVALCNRHLQGCTLRCGKKARSAWLVRCQCVARVVPLELCRALAASARTNSSQHPLCLARSVRIPQLRFFLLLPANAARETPTICASCARSSQASRVCDRTCSEAARAHPTAPVSRPSDIVRVTPNSAARETPTHAAPAAHKHPAYAKNSFYGLARDVRIQRHLFRPRHPRRFGVT